MREKFNFKMVSGQMISLLLSILFPVIAMAADFKVIANKNVPVDSLTKEDIKAIYLGKKTKWGDGSKINFYLLKRPNDQEEFLSEYLGKTPAQYEHFWMQNVFSGKGVMPEVFEGKKDMINTVEKTNGSLGFVNGAVQNDKVKMIVVE